MLKGQENTEPDTVKPQGLRCPGGNASPGQQGSVKIKTEAFFLGCLHGQGQGSCFGPHFPGHPSISVYDMQPWVHMVETGRQTTGTGG